LWILICLIVLVGFFLGYRYLKKKSTFTKTNYLLYTVKKGDIESTVSSIGSILAVDTRDITALPGSTVSEIYCTENQVVEKGSSLFLLTNESANLDLERAKLNLSQQQSVLTNLNTQKSDLVIHSPVSGIVRSISVSKEDTVAPPFGFSGLNMMQVEDTSIMKFSIYSNPSDSSKNMKGMMPSTKKIIINFQGVGTKECTILSTNISPQGSTVTFQVLDPNELEWDNFYTITIPIMLGVEIPISTPVQVVGNMTAINAKQNGIVDSIPVKIGDIVRKGQILATIRSDMLTNQIQSAALNIKSLELDVKNRQKIVDDLTVRAPIDGIIYNILYNEGDMVTKELSNTPTALQAMNSLPKTQNQSSASLATIENRSKMKVSISIDELDIGKIRQGQKALVTLDAYKDKVFVGHISTVAAKGIVQNGTATFQADIIIEQSENLITGMSANVVIMTDSKKNVLLLPIDAIQSKKDRRFVLIQTEKGIIEKDIRVGIVNEDFAEILEGLTIGLEVLLPIPDSRIFNNPNASGSSQPRFPLMQGGFQGKHPFATNQP